MSESGRSPRVAIVVGVLALAPVAVYGLTRSPAAGAIAGVNVLLIVGGLLVAMRPVEPPNTTGA